MGSVNLNILGLASAGIVLDAQGRLRQLAPGEQPASNDVVISFADNEERVPSVSARFVDSQGQQSDLEIDNAIAQVERAIEGGFDPTELGDEFDTAAGDQGSSLTNSSRIERTGTESQAETDFETSGFESQGLSVTQSLTLFDIIALTLVSGETNAVELEQDQPIEASGSLTLDKLEVIFIEQEVIGENGLGTFTVNADGTWTFLANNSFNELGIGQQTQDSTIVRTSDGVEQRITVTIVGTDDRAIATNGSGSVIEDIGFNEEISKLQTSGEVTIIDVDSTTPTFLPNSAFDGGKSTNTTQLGELSIAPSGSWIYNVNNDDVQY